MEGLIFTGGALPPGGGVVGGVRHASRLAWPAKAILTADCGRPVGVMGL